MRRHPIVAIAFVAVLVLVACSKSSFSGKKVEKQAGVDQTITAMGIEESTDGGTKQIGPNDKVNFVIQTADWRVLAKNENRVVQPVDLFFVLDITASMEQAIATIKNGINALTDRLSQQGINLNVGLVKFVDAMYHVDNESLALTSDKSKLQSMLAGTTTIGNGDYPESSMYAATKTIDFFRQQSRPDAMKALLLITDVVGHNGDTVDSQPPVSDRNRDCSVLPFASSALAYAQSLTRHSDFKFFYTVPDPSMAIGTAEPGAIQTCKGRGVEENNAYNATTQMQEIVNRLPQENVGGALIDPKTGKIAWPLSDSNFVDTLAPMLQNNVTSTDVRGLCFATSAELFEQNTKVKTWSPTELAQLNQQMKNGNNQIQINDAYKPGSVGEHNLQMRIQRCCVEQSVLDRGQTTCAKNYQQVISYKVIVK